MLEYYSVVITEHYSLVLFEYSNAIRPLTRPPGKARARHAADLV